MMRLATGLLAIVLTAPALMAQSAVEDRLTKIESEIKALRAENDALRRQLAAVAPDAAVKPVANAAEEPAAGAPAVQPEPQTLKPAGKEQRLQLGGLVQFQGESGGRPDSRFGDDHDRMFLRRARLNASGKFDQRFEFKAELDATGSLSNSTGMRVQLVDGYATWTKSTALAIRMGQFKTPFGFEQLYSDQQLPSIERTLGNDRLVPGRQLGAQLAGGGFDERLSYAVGAFNGTGTNTNVNDGEGFLVAGRLTSAVLRKPKSHEALLRVGINAFRSNDRNVAVAPDFGIDSTPASPAVDAIFAGRRSAAGADAQLCLGKVELWTEMLRERFEPDSAVPRRTFDAKSWYVLAAAPLVGDKLQGVVRYDSFDPNGSLSGDQTRSWLVGTNYYIKGHDLKLQLHYLRSDWAGKSDGRLIARFQTIF
jgi:phosphate-selective porin